MQVPADRLDAGGHEDVALACLDGVGRHADRLQRRRAVAVHHDAWHIGEPGEQRRDPTDVVAGLTSGRAAAQDDVFHELRIELRGLLEDRLDDEPGQIIGAAFGEAALVGPADRRPGGRDDDGFGHVSISWGDPGEGVFQSGRVPARSPVRQVPRMSSMLRNKICGDPPPHDSAEAQQPQMQ